MFSHVMVGSSDLEKSKRFYDAVLATLGVGAPFRDKDRYFYRAGGASFAITTPINGEPPSAANGGTIGFTASSAEAVEAFHAAGVANGGTSCEDPPGVRPSGFGDLYLAYLRDPDGNKICAMFRQR